MVTLEKILGEYRELSISKKLAVILVIISICILMAINDKLILFLRLWFSTSLAVVVHLEWRKRERELDDSLIKYCFRKKSIRYKK